MSDSNLRRRAVAAIPSLFAAATLAIGTAAAGRDSFKIAAFGPAGGSQPISGAKVCAKVQSVSNNLSARAAHNMEAARWSLDSNGTVKVWIPPVSSKDHFEGVIRFIVVKDGWCPQAVELEYFWDHQRKSAQGEVDQFLMSVVRSDHHTCQSAFPNTAREWTVQAQPYTTPHYYNAAGENVQAGDQIIKKYMGAVLTCDTRPSVKAPVVPKPMPSDTRLERPGLPDPGTIDPKRSRGGPPPRVR